MHDQVSLALLLFRFLPHALMARVVRARYYMKEMLSVAIPNLSHPDWHYRRAAIMFIGNSSEGCHLQFRERLHELLPIILALANVSTELGSATP